MCARQETHNLLDRTNAKRPPTRPSGIRREDAPFDGKEHTLKEMQRRSKRVPRVLEGRRARRPHMVARNGPQVLRSSRLGHEAEQRRLETMRGHI